MPGRAMASPVCLCQFAVHCDELVPDECTMLFWNVEGVQEVYLIYPEGQVLPFEGQGLYARHRICNTLKDYSVQTFRLHITYPDDTSDDRYIDVTFEAPLE